MIKTFCIGGYDGGILETFHWLFGWEPEGISKADCLFLPGGSDVNPKLYGEKALSKTSYDQDADDHEVDFYHAARKRNIPIFGICKGAQLVHVLNGGRLWQHVNGHAIGRTHPVLDLATGNKFHCTSYHHQMMRVDDITSKNVPYRVVAIASQSTERLAYTNQSLAKTGTHPNDIEVLWYPGIKALCYQGHPEYGNRMCTMYFVLLMERFGFISREEREKASNLISQVEPDAKSLAI